MKLLTTLCATLFATFTVFSQNILHVNINSQASSPTGSSWNDAFSNLQTAIAAYHPGDEVWVAQGVYKPTQGSDRFAMFMLPSGIRLYGGFDGTETVREQRDWTNNASILSGDIGAPGDSTDNTYCLVYAAATDSNTVIDGFTVEWATANRSDNNYDYYRPTLSGAGIYLDGDGQLFGKSSLSVFNCIIQHNTAVYSGGGVYANGRGNGAAILNLKNCLFFRNRGNAYGGGLLVENYTDQSPPLVISDCKFIDNYGGSGQGKGVLISHNQAIKIERCQFLRNQVYGAGGALAFSWTTNHNRPIEVVDCNFEENIGGDGINIKTWNTTQSMRIKVSRCRFYAQQAGAIGILGGQSDTLEVDNCLFFSNNSYTISQDYLAGFSTLAPFKVTNCLFYKNWSALFWYNTENNQRGSVEINNSIIIDEQGTPGYALGNTVNASLKNCITNDTSLVQMGPHVVVDQNTRFDIDPLFLYPAPEANADFHLMPCSPAINTGDNAILDSLGITTDLEGNPRIRNGQVDIGPFEMLQALNLSVAATPLCAGGHEGAIAINGNQCGPFTGIVWSNGSATGTELTGLAAGLYHITATDANGQILVDSIVVPEPAPLELHTTVMLDGCVPDVYGNVQRSIQGGTPFAELPHYHYVNDPGSTFLAPGTYTYDIVDANGCTASSTAVVETVPEYVFYYTITNASGPNNHDGAVQFDSVSGGWGPVLLPNDVSGLAPGNYSFTVTDVQGCKTEINLTVGFTSATVAPESEFLCEIFPNPAISNGIFTVKTTENEPFIVKIFDQQGKLLLTNSCSGQQNAVPLNGIPPGVYRVEITGERGKIAVQKMVVR